MSLAPIVLFVYNRLWHTQKTVEALMCNTLASESNLTIYSDYPKNEEAKKSVNLVREYIKTIGGFHNVLIVERQENFGLAKNIISGVTEIIQKYDKVIIMEDDLLTSPYFLKYMNEALDYYQNDPRIFTITGYNHPSSVMRIPPDYTQDVYFNPRNSSWGWATWKDRWEKADWGMKDYPQFILDKKAQKKFNYGGDDLTDMLNSQMNGRINSWSIRWSFTHFRHGGLCVYPVISFVKNIGMDGSGIHCGIDKSKKFSNHSLSMRNNIQFLKDILVNEKIMNEFRKVYRKSTTQKFRDYLNFFRVHFSGTNR
jgi:hypothetical protein